MASTPIVAPQYPAPARPAINPWVIALTVTLATFMELLDTSIANVALPHIAGGLGRSFDEVTWILTTYDMPLLLRSERFHDRIMMHA